MIGGLVWSYTKSYFHVSNGVPPAQSTLQIGNLLMNEYVLPFELASVLLLAALIGALVVAWDRK